MGKICFNNLNVSIRYIGYTFISSSPFVVAHNDAKRTSPRYFLRLAIIMTENRRSHVVIVFLLIKRKIIQQEDTSRIISPSREAPLKNIFSLYAGGELHVSI